jgi:hypothetical protein
MILELLEKGKVYFRYRIPGKPVRHFLHFPIDLIPENSFKNERRSSHAHYRLLNRSTDSAIFKFPLPDTLLLLSFCGCVGGFIKAPFMEQQGNKVV